MDFFSLPMVFLQLALGSISQWGVYLVAYNVATTNTGGALTPTSSAPKFAL